MIVDRLNANLVLHDKHRAALAALKARRDRKILEWEMALKVQAAWRGRLAKMLVLGMRIVQVIYSFTTGSIQPTPSLTTRLVFEATQ